MGLAEVLAGIAVVLAVEGLLYATFPAAMRRALLAVAALGDQHLRRGGLVAAALGIALAWFIMMA